jgi:hypothetical protein
MAASAAASRLLPTADIVHSEATQQKWTTTGN